MCKRMVEVKGGYDTQNLQKTRICEMDKSLQKNILQTYVNNTDPDRNSNNRRHISSDNVRSFLRTSL